MRRREITTLLGAAVVWPLATRAQVKERPTLPLVGLLSSNLIDGYDFIYAVRLKLAEFGLLEGRDFRVESTFAAGDDDRLAGLAADLVRFPVAVILTQGGPAIRAARNATMSIPIVMVTDVDPVADGLVASLARPGGNLTGIALLANELAIKRVEFLKELVPDLRRVGLLINPDDAGTESARRTLAAATGRLGLTSQVLAVRRESDIEPALTGAVTSGCGAVFVVPDRTISVLTAQIVNLAVAKRLPMMYPNRYYVSATLQALISYGPIPIEVSRRVASLVARILKGARPVDLPIEQPVEFELAVNLQTARALGLTIPQSLLARTDQVIE